MRSVPMEVVTVLGAMVAVVVDPDVFCPLFLLAAGRVVVLGLYYARGCPVVCY